MCPPPVRLAAALALALVAVACGGTLDAGYDQSHTKLPVDERNPVILENDGWKDNWLGEYALLLTANGGPRLIGIVASASRYWPNADDNAAGWTNLVAAARDSGMQNLPDVTASAGPALERPADGRIESTRPNRSAGAQLIVERSRRFSQPSRPVVILACAPLTNVADAYLLDPTVADRVVVVSMLGLYEEPNGFMSGPNGDLDPWADWIVAQRFRYVQISAYYDQLGDVADDDLASLPPNPFGAWMAAKQPDVFDVPTASDQIAILSVGLPTFAMEVQRVSPDLSAGFNAAGGLPLRPSPDGNAWIVTQIAAPLAASRLWHMLLGSTTTFGS
jgi:hypothetical protein